MVYSVVIDMVMVALDDRLRLGRAVVCDGVSSYFGGVGGRGMVQLAYFLEGSCREMKEIVGVKVVLMCPPVEGCNCILKIKVGKIVLENEGRAKCSNLMHHSYADKEKGWQLRVFGVTNFKEKCTEVFIDGGRWV